MKTKSDYIRYISLALIFLVAGILIYQTYPNIAKFKYTYVVDKPWEYDALTAPYAFEILKSKEELKKEQDSLLKDFLPFYRNVSEIPSKYINILNNNFGKVDGTPADEYKKIHHPQAKRDLRQWHHIRRGAGQTQRRREERDQCPNRQRGEGGPRLLPLHNQERIRAHYQQCADAVGSDDPTRL